MVTLGNGNVLLQPQLSCIPTRSGSHASVKDSAQTSQAGKVMPTPLQCSPVATVSRATVGCPRELRGKDAQAHFPLGGNVVTLLGRVGDYGACKDRARTSTTGNRSKSPVAYLSPIWEEDDFSSSSGTGALYQETWASEPPAASKSSESLREHVRTPRKKGVSREDTKSCEHQASTAEGTQSPIAGELLSGDFHHPEASWLVNSLLQRMTLGQVSELVSSITRPELVTSSINNASTAKLQLDSGALAPDRKIQNQSCGIHSPRATAAEPRLGSRAVTPDRRTQDLSHGICSPMGTTTELLLGSRAVTPDMRTQDLSCGIHSPRATASEFRLGSKVVTPDRRTQNLSCGTCSPRDAADLQLGSGAVTPERKTQNLSCGICSTRSTGTRPRPCWK
eukprot:TRINITY_DN2070_c0_g1_i1.p1 TRINITY_DN2070_c0_g1~~TRINITY_DN2070_c0_g1_i1.p1  ORF type:complete len:393 (-),score=32.77 TRINITY_DN2070_c0_g1_i1:425-1603(-)